MPGVRAARYVPNSEKGAQMAKKSRKRKQGQRPEPLSLDPLSPEEALGGFMAVNPERVRRRERGKPVDYLCQTCGETFGAQVVHCSECDHHYPLVDGECGNCHREWPDDAKAAVPVEE